MSVLAAFLLQPAEPSPSPSICCSDPTLPPPASLAETGYSPVINMFMDARMGRFSEGFSPNPTLSAHVAKAIVEGLQGENTPLGAEGYLPDFNRTIAALGKHYAGYGDPAGGLNSAAAAATNQTVQEVYLKPWRSFAWAGGRAVMASHQTTNGIPMHANRKMLTDQLRG